MNRLLIAALLALPSLAYTQAIPFEQRRPLVSVTASAAYVFNDAQNGHNRSLWGWSAVPEANLTWSFGIQGDFAGLYMRSVYPGQNRFIMAAGPRYTFAPRFKVRPFIFAEGGKMKVTLQGSPVKDWNPVVLGGFGLEHRVSRGISFTLVPGEYLGQHQDDGSWNHSFSARAGITFNL